MTGGSTTEPGRRAASLPAKLGLAAGGVLVLLVTLEGGARLLGVRAPPGLTPSARTCVQRDALLGQQFRPSCTGEMAGTAFRTNALGLRGEEIVDDGSRRILALGDSCTWGWDVGDRDAYPSVLQQILNARGGAERYQVINAGFPGYTSRQGLLFLRERGPALHPDIVLIAFGFNDRFRSGDIEARLARNRDLLPLLQLDDLLNEWSALYHWARARPAEEEQAGATPRVSPERYERNLSEMIQLVRARGGQPVLISFLQAHDTMALGPYVQAERRVEHDLGVPAIGYKGPRLDVIHPTADGYRHFVEGLVAAMDAAGYLDGQPRGQ